MIAEIFGKWRTPLTAVLASALALGSALGFASGLRAEARRTSHQLYSPELLFEAPSPTSPKLIHDGRALFLHNCSHCHGIDATGDEGPDLHGLEVSDRYIANTIRRGIKGEMPAFSRKLDRDALTQLTAYLRSLPEDS